MEGDSLTVIEALSRRASVFSPDGKYTRTYQTRQRPLWCGTSGLAAGLAAPTTPRDGSQFAVARTRVELLNSDGVTIATSDSLDFYDIAWMQRAPAARPLGKRLLLTVRQSDVVVLAHDAGRLLVLDRAGKVTRSSAIAIEQIPATKEALERDLDYLLSYEPRRGEGSPLRESLRNLPLPSRIPSAFGLWGDGSGLLWVQTSPRGVAPTHFSVFNDQGKQLAKMTSPFSLNVFEVAGDHIVAGVEEADGTPAVVVLRIERR